MKFHFAACHCRFVNQRVSQGATLAEIHRAFVSHFKAAKGLTFDQFMNARSAALVSGLMQRSGQGALLAGAGIMTEKRRKNMARLAASRRAPDADGACEADGCRNHTKGRFCEAHVGHLLND